MVRCQCGEKKNKKKTKKQTVQTCAQRRMEISKKTQVLMIWGKGGGVRDEGGGRGLPEDMCAFEPWEREKTWPTLTEKKRYCFRFLCTERTAAPCPVHQSQRNFWSRPPPPVWSGRWRQQPHTLMWKMCHTGWAWPTKTCTRTAKNSHWIDAVKRKKKMNRGSSQKNKTACWGGGGRFLGGCVSWFHLLCSAVLRQWVAPWRRSLTATVTEGANK